jgi:hypothetical protein
VTFVRGIFHGCYLVVWHVANNSTYYTYYSTCNLYGASAVMRSILTRDNELARTLYAVGICAVISYEWLPSHAIMALCLIYGRPLYVYCVGHIIQDACAVGIHMFSQSWIESHNICWQAILSRRMNYWCMYRRLPSGQLQYCQTAATYHCKVMHRKLPRPTVASHIGLSSVSRYDASFQIYSSI